LLINTLKRKGKRKEKKKREEERKRQENTCPLSVQNIYTQQVYMKDKHIFRHRYDILCLFLLYTVFNVSKKLAEK